MIDQQILDDIDEALARKEIKRAEVVLARLLRGKDFKSEERAALLVRRARARLEGARPDDALEDLQTALALDETLDEDVRARVLRGDIYFARFELAPFGFADRTDTDTARACYENVLATVSEHPLISWVHYQLGRILLSENKVESAAVHFQKAIAVPPYPPNIHAFCYERLGFIELFEHRQAESALRYFNLAIENYPSSDDPGWLIQLYLRISRAYLELGRHQEALDIGRRALRGIQDGSTYRAALPEAHFALGEVLSTMPGSEAEAIEHYLRFLQSSKRPLGIDVTWSQVHETIGNLSFRLERYQQAIVSYEKALEFNPYHPWEVNLRYQIARCHYRMRDYERTVEAIEKMKKTADSDNAPITDWRVYNLLGNANFALEKYRSAAEAYRRAIELATPSAAGLEKTHIYLRFSEELMRSPN
jgi:tetratricopeptide (TPR) repeat protein